MANWNAASVSVLCLILVDIILCIVSLATDYWSDVEISIGSTKSQMNRGLIKVCIDHIGCSRYENEGVPGYIRGALAGMSLALISDVAALITMFLWTAGEGSKGTMRFLKIITWVFLGIAVLWYIIAVAVYADNDKSSGGYINRTSDNTLSWSWGTAILAGLLDILAGVVILFAERRD